MKTTLITLKVEGVVGTDGKPRVCLWWYLPGGDPLAPDGGVCCDDLGEALRHVRIALDERMDDLPERPLPEEPEPAAAGLAPGLEAERCG